MKIAIALLPFALCLSAAAAELTEIHKVYVLPMTSSFDQYMVDRIVQHGKFTVVTDPMKADAFFTDRVGESLDNKLDDIMVTKAEKKKRAEEAEKNDTGAAPARMVSFSKGRGTVFLVDRQSRNVLWSTYVRPKTSTPDDLHKIADEVLSRLEKAIKAK